jgi:hypothetical protein
MPRTQAGAGAWPHALLAACGGFLAAVLWFDLMFDVQVRAHVPPAPLPEATLASLAAYYARVTREAAPMHLAVALVMAVAVLGSAWTTRDRRERALRWLALAVAVLPIGLAAFRVLPNAARLGERTGSAEAQSALARAIYHDHLLCLAAIATFTALQVLLAARAGSGHARVSR